jgi:uncharacterized membrane protein
MAAIPSPAWRRIVQPLVSRPSLAIGTVTGIACYFLATPLLARDITRLLVSWDLGVVVFVSLALWAMRQCPADEMKSRAIGHDEGRHVVLVLALSAAGASIAAIVAELSGAKSRGQVFELYSVALTIGTIALSWFFVHLVFAFHYAHAYYLATELADADPRRGLDFPDDDAPDYWDFLYFALVIGSTAQTADVNIHSKGIRRTATVHGVISFAFNTAILATMINLASGLF